MAYKVTFEERTDYVYAHMEGPESYEEAVRFWVNLEKISQKNGFTKVLVVDEVTGRLNTIQIHNLSQKVAELFRGLKIAFVDPKEETYEDNKYGETVVYNRGAWAKVFRDEKEALDWLLEE